MARIIYTDKNFGAKYDRLSSFYSIHRQKTICLLYSMCAKPVLAGQKVTLFMKETDVSPLYTYNLIFLKHSI